MSDNKRLSKSAIVLTTLALLNLGGCAAMPTTHSGFLSQERPQPIPAQVSMMSVEFRLQDKGLLTSEERDTLKTRLETELRKSLAVKGLNLKASSVQVGLLLHVWKPCHRFST